MQLKRLVLPAPFGPMSPEIFPLGILRETLFKAQKVLK